MTGAKDVAIRRMPTPEYQAALKAAGARGMTVGEYLAKCVLLHQRVILDGTTDVQSILEELELVGTTT